MHDCLTIPEILQIIFENFQSLERSREDRRALAALARTSNAFSALALDELWKELYDLEPIVCCMPSDLFSGRGEDRKLLRPIKASDWHRPRIYLNRVKRIYISHDSLVPTNIFPALNASLPAGEVESHFRKLTSLQWSYQKDLLNIRFLLSPKLNTLALGFPSSLTNSSFLSSIPLVCPGLKELSVYSMYSSLEGPSISELIRGLHSLRKIHIAVPDLASLEHLSRLKGLTSFTCSLSNTLPILHSPLSFIALEEVTVLDGNFETIIDFFSRCSLPVLKRLEISPSSSATTTNADKLHRALSGSCPPSSLTALTLNFDAGGVAEEHPDMYTIPFRSFEPLLCFFNLTSISIGSKSGICLNDEEMEIIARTWPHLRRLSLWERVESQTLSLRSLSTLAEHCPCLNSLSLSLDARYIPELPTSNARQPVSQLALHELCIGRSPISGPAIYTTRFLSSIFPNLSRVITEVGIWGLDELGEDEDSELQVYHELWMEVESQLSIFRAVREEERAKALADKS
ncbi:hypothetical protein R3P38DRAFT_2910905 [Favolaschia claudopus]|uniref:F-box domain-containing protein n=1 Tax=Favolaschia claudopus TaxID=2862362 RepID=A0AAW0CCF4_9AGAR